MCSSNFDAECRYSYNPRGSTSMQDEQYYEFEQIFSPIPSKLIDPWLHDSHMSCFTSHFLWNIATTPIPPFSDPLGFNVMMRLWWVSRALRRLFVTLDVSGKTTPSVVFNAMKTKVGNHKFERIERKVSWFYFVHVVLILILLLNYRMIKLCKLPTVYRASNHWRS